MLHVAVYPGSFDPVTLGHLDLIERGSRLFDRLVVGVASNPKKECLFSLRERVEMLGEVTGHLGNVDVREFDGLLVDFVRSVQSHIVVRGLRAIQDFEYELNMTLTNRQLAPDIETFFLMPNLQYTYLRASLVKNVASLGGELSAFVPKPVIGRLQERCAERNGGE